jgi:ABC-2 type transport system ATP-binding protein
MDQAEQLCDSVCIIAEGRKVLDGPLAEIRRQHAGHRHRLEFESVTPEVLALMDGERNRFPGAVRAGNSWNVDLPDAAAVQRALAALASANVRVARFEHVTPSLHEIFVQHVGHAEIAARRPEVTRA